MKIRFGEFPEHHSFLLITRPFVEWSFKLVGWIILTATLRYAYQKTSSYFLLGLTIFAYLLLFGFVGGFVEWCRNFKFNSMPPARPTNVRDTKGFRRVFGRARRIATVSLGFAIAALMVGAMNTVVDQAIDSIIGHYEKLRP
jgi:hypothetical protein